MIRHSLYLDTCITNNQMINACYLSNVHTSCNPLVLHCNAGSTSTRTAKRGYLGMHPIWLDSGGLANVISLRSLKKNYVVTYDSRVWGGAFICKMEKADLVFKQCPKMGIPFIDLGGNGNPGFMLIQAIGDNYEGFTRRAVTIAVEARIAQA